MKINVIIILLQTSIILIFNLFEGKSQDRQLGEIIKVLVDENNILVAKELLGKYDANNAPSPQSKFTSFRIHLKSGDSTAELDAAYEDMNFATNNYSLLSEKERKTNCNLIDFCPDKFKYYWNLLDSSLFDAYTKTNDILTISLFISRYPANPYADKAKSVKNRLSYLNSKNANTEESYSIYLDEYPEGYFSDSARILMWQIAFDRANQDNSIESLSRFLKKYPDAPQAEATRKILWEKAWSSTLEKNTKNSYKLFTENYPNSPYINEALKKIEEIDWNETIAKGDIQTYENFISYYPKSPKVYYADSSAKSLRRIDELNEIIDKTREAIEKNDINKAEILLSDIKKADPKKYLISKDSILSRISYIKEIKNLTLGKFFHGINRYEIHLLFGINEDSTTYCQIKNFINGLTPDELNLEAYGTFTFGPKKGQILIDWDNEEWDNTLSDITVSKTKGLVSISSKKYKSVFKKLSDDYQSEIEPKIKPKKEYVPPKLICGRQWYTTSDLEKILSEIDDNWDARISAEVRSQYREFLNDVYAVGTSSYGILLKGTGNITQTTYTIVWTCNGIILVYRGVISDY